MPAKKKTSQKKTVKSKVEIEGSVVDLIYNNAHNSIYLDPNTGIVELEGKRYQLRHLHSKTKLTFNNKGELDT